MNYNPKYYAQAFCRTKGGEKEIKNLLSLVRKNRDSRKLKEILFFVEKISGRKITIESARPLTEKSRKLIRSVVEESGTIREKVEPSLIAGIRVNINDEIQLDGSFLNKIKNILNI